MSAGTSQGWFTPPTPERGMSSTDPADWAAEDALENALLNQEEGRSTDPDDWAAEDEAENRRLEAERRKNKFQKGNRFSGPDPRERIRRSARSSRQQQQQPKPKPAEDESVIAEDGQTLSKQTPWTQNAFRAQYGARADVEWVKQHNEELRRNRALYGVSEPKTGQNPLSSAPSGTPVAPNRKIGEIAPPYAAPKTGQQPQNRQYTTPTGQVLAFPPNQPYLGSVSATPDSTGQIPTTLSPSSETTPVSQRQNRESPLVAGARLGRFSTVSDKYYVNPDGTIYKFDAQGKLISVGVNRDEYESGLPIPPDDPAIAPTTRNPETDASMNNVIRMGNRTPGAPVPPEEKPVNYLASLGLKGDRTPEALEAESRRILTGIGGLLRGDISYAWAEPYLNDIARMAWVKQERAAGRQADPRKAPVEYIESWKDAFYGSDTGVPFVKELDQQMIDYAVSRTPEGKPFDWRVAFGPTGENGLISRQVASNDCGPNAFATMLRSRGYNADPNATFQFAKSTGYHDGEQFTGPYNMSRMLRQEAGLESETKPVDWNAIDRELAEGRPVALSSTTHYWVVTAKRNTANGPQYYTGATGAVVGNPEWARPDQLYYAGYSPSYMVTAKGDVDPNSRAIQTMGLRPPGQQYSGRAALSTQTTAALARENRVSTLGQGEEQRVRYSNEIDIDPSEMYGPIVQRAARTYNVDENLIYAVITAEAAGGDPRARSSQGATGIMQLMPATARSLGVNDIEDPVENIMGGAKYLRQLLDMFDGDVELAVAAYNAGPGAVLQAGGVPNYEETRIYVPRVLQRYRARTGTGVR